MAVLTMEVSERHTRARAIIRDHVFPANRAIGGGERVSRGDARVVSDVSVSELQRISGQKLYPVIEFENGAIYCEESKDMAATIRAGQLDEKRGASN